MVGILRVLVVERKIIKIVCHLELPLPVIPFQFHWGHFQGFWKLKLLVDQRPRHIFKLKQFYKFSFLFNLNSWIWNLQLNFVL